MLKCFVLFFYLLDIKDCDRQPCSHICLELDGSYRCLCPIGYYLGPDDETCLGKSTS